jgi:hypothetical protein
VRGRCWHNYWSAAPLMPFCSCWFSLLCLCSKSENSSVTFILCPCMSVITQG